MPRPQGAANVVAFVDRDEIATTKAQEIRHLARQVNLTALE